MLGLQCCAVRCPAPICCLHSLTTASWRRVVNTASPSSHTKFPDMLQEKLGVGWEPHFIFFLIEIFLQCICPVSCSLIRRLAVFHFCLCCVWAPLPSQLLSLFMGCQSVEASLVRGHGRKNGNKVPLNHSRSLCHAILFLSSSLLLSPSHSSSPPP